MMEKIINIKNKIIELVLAQKILSAVLALILFMLIGIIYISISRTNVTKAPNPLSLNTNQTTISRHVTGIPTQIANSPTNSIPNKQKTNPTPRQFITGQSPSIATQIQPTKTQPSISKTITPGPTNKTTVVQSAPVGSGGTQPTVALNPTTSPSPDSNPTSVPSSSPQIVFIGPSGQAQPYTPPSTPPVEITWARYTNQLEHYAIDYPSNWQIVKTQYRGHEAVFIYGPGTNPSDPNIQYISYGWSTYFYPPEASYVGSFTLDGVKGTIYTNGSMGSSFIAGIFNYANGFLVLNNNISDETFTYIFNHMILSLDFNTP
jgi:hypothetical protein